MNSTDNILREIRNDGINVFQKHCTDQTINLRDSCRLILDYGLSYQDIEAFASLSVEDIKAKIKSLE